MSAAAEPSALLRVLHLEEIGEDRFRGSSPWATGRVYGGQAVGQALVAAQRTTPRERVVHSLHAYFILAGDAAAPIDYAVERVRDGASFTTRRVVASQHGRAIFSMEASFQIVEPGFEHAFPAPNAPPPESLPTTSALAERFASFLPPMAAECIARTSALDIRFSDPSAYFSHTPQTPAQQFIWFRVIGALPDDDATHRGVLAYLSDMTLLNTALVIHGRSIFDRDLQVASLDHAVWFHRPFRADQWLLYAQDSPTAAGARALTRGLVYTLDGRLVASVAQEGLIRERPPRG
ncbi:MULTISPECIES: acyl-CoA thioesterase [Methylosinus]|uniref:Acyl-CoA thioesterase 2 n=1 Tax=Methylosinus trichosporium (strain ATCC 35070 / NCIMB 11131 / UNIQEM 75 / OB3b) TaxID=595536 RepID=A0A2D2CX27_METT3|nr:MULTISPECIES: acyl-CoA thioesterase II [Methylosinus]ATQ67300.1 acyl-CoA thioesterase II [Methylosinus trichosporium OB3b]OBS52078.1 acyl-CoA thioesterase II [Methylosinus sp. 3S-1]